MARRRICCNHSYGSAELRVYRSAMYASFSPSAWVAAKPEPHPAEPEQLIIVARACRGLALRPSEFEIAQGACCVVDTKLAARECSAKASCAICRCCTCRQDPQAIAKDPDQAGQVEAWRPRDSLSYRHSGQNAKMAVLPRAGLCANPQVLLASNRKSEGAVRAALRDCRSRHRQPDGAGAKRLDVHRFHSMKRSRIVVTRSNACSAATMPRAG